MVPPLALIGLALLTGVSLFSGMVATAAGLAMVLGHEVWSGGALPVLVSMMGWAALLITMAMFLRAIDPLPHDAPGLARVLKGAGAERVEAWVFARTPRPGDD